MSKRPGKKIGTLEVKRDRKKTVKVELRLEIDNGTFWAQYEGTWYSAKTKDDLSEQIKTAVTKAEAMVRSTEVRRSRVARARVAMSLRNDGHTFREIGEALSITGNRAQQIISWGEHNREWLDVYQSDDYPGGSIDTHRSRIRKADQFRDIARAKADA